MIYGDSLESKSAQTLKVQRALSRACAASSQFREKLGANFLLTGKSAAELGKTQLSLAFRRAGPSVIAAAGSIIAKRL